MEDRYTLAEVDNMILLAVWDGHGGKECSQFCSDKVEKELRRQIEKQQLENEKVDLGKTLHHLVLELNTAFERHWSNKAERSPGSTATLALIRGGYELVVANVGDSRAILCRNGEARALTKDHCPSDPQKRNGLKHMVAQFHMTPSADTWSTTGWPCPDP